MYKIKYSRGNRQEISCNYHSLWTARYVAENYIMSGWYWEKAEIIDTATNEIKETIVKENWNSANVASAIV